MSLLTRRNIIIALAVIAIPILAIAWWLLAPLFTDTEVSDDFPMSATADIPADMTKREAEDIMQGMAKISMTQKEDMMGAMNEATVLASGEFRDGDSYHKGSGDVALYKLAGGDHVLRFENLDVTNGPDLRVLLSSHADPMSKSELNDAGFELLAKLKGNKGDQNYEIPADIDVEPVNSVIIYCWPFKVIFSVAPLEMAQ